MNYIVKAFIYATITLGLVACSQEDINSTEQQKAKEEITFTVDVTLDKNVEDMVNAKQMTKCMGCRTVCCDPYTYYLR